MTTPPTSGAADLPEALRVPLDSLHADAGYLCGRLLNGSLTQEQVVESIRRRIDAAKLAALTAQAIARNGRLAFNFNHLRHCGFHHYGSATQGQRLPLPLL